MQLIIDPLLIKLKSIIALSIKVIGRMCGGDEGMEIFLMFSLQIFAIIFIFNYVFRDRPAA